MYCLYSSIFLSRPGRFSVTSGMLCTLVLPIFQTVMPASAYRFLICKNPSAVLRSGVEPTLTYSAPIWLRKRRSSSVGLAGDWAHNLMPGAIGCTVADAVRGDAKTPAALRAPPTASLTNSLRSGEKPLLAISDGF